MIKKFLVSLLLTVGMGQLFADDCNPCKTLCPPEPCECKTLSHTFFSVRPLFAAGSPERTTLFHDRMMAKDDGRDGAFQVVVFGGRSTKPENIAAFFAPACQNMFTVCEDISPTLSDECDMLSPHFNIYTSNCGSQILSRNRNGINTSAAFKSEFSFAPRRYEAGVGFNWRQGFARRDDGRGFYAEVAFDVTHVKSRMNLCETVEQDGCSVLEVESAVAPDGTVTRPVANVTEAFQQTAWKYGRIESDSSCDDDTVTRVGGIEILVGYDAVRGDTYYMSSHAGYLAPTGNRVKGELMFEPIVGHNKHHIIRYGSDFGVELWHHKDEDRSIWFMFNTEFFFTLRNRQTRSFDLKNKPWSRYMQMYENQNQAQLAIDTNNFYLHTPGINLMTQQVCVDAGTWRTYQSAFVYNCKSFQGEVGYTFFCRPAECVRLECAFPEGAALKSIISEGDTNSVQQIGNTFGDVNAINIDEYKTNIITEDDLDLHSAEHPGTVTYTIYGSLGRRWDDREYPLFAGAGGSYEFADDNNGINRWTLWFKMGVSY